MSVEASAALRRNKSRFELSSARRRTQFITPQRHGTIQVVNTTVAAVFDRRSMLKRRRSQTTATARRGAPRLRSAMVDFYHADASAVIQSRQQRSIKIRRQGRRDGSFKIVCQARPAAVSSAAWAGLSCQSLFVRTSDPLLLRSSRAGFATEDKPNPLRLGPMPRTIEPIEQAQCTRICPRAKSDHIKSRQGCSPTSAGLRVSPREGLRG